MPRPPAELFDALAHEYDEMRVEVGWDPFVHVEAAFPDVRGWSMVDVGCGTGEVTAALVKRGARLVGLDVSAEMCALGRARLPGVPFLQHDLNHALPLATAEFDGVLALGCLEYARDVHAVCADLARLLKPGGVALYVVELCGADMPDGADRVVPFLDAWERHRVTLEEATNTATALFAEARIDRVPGYVLEDTGERVQYARVIGVR